jgi:hypothetical protein
MKRISRAQKVRDYLEAHPKAKPQDVVAALSATGDKINSRYVSQIKHKQRKSNTKKTDLQAPAVVAVESGADRSSARRNRASRASRPYPARTLEEALVVPKAIRERNNGNPWDPEDIARASLGVAKSNNKFFYTAAAARDYGLTIGTRDTEEIELAPLGREIFFAADEETKQAKMREAFFSIDIFKRVFEHYGSAELPKKEFLTNTQADLVIADLTDHNPNVLFELGIRIAKDLPVALIKSEGTGQIFDVDNMMRVLPYSANLWPATLERDIPRMTEHIKGAWDNRSTERTYPQILTGKEKQQ